MNPYRIAPPPRWWGPAMKPGLVRMLRSFRRWRCARVLKLGVVQLFSYPGDYVAEKPSIERLAETLDKFEEDLLGKYSATVRSARRATVRFGEPVAVETGRSRREAARVLTDTLERRVQEMLDELSASEGG